MSERPQPMPEALIPRHIGGESEAVKTARKTDKKPKEISHEVHDIREKELHRAPWLEDVLRGELEAEKKEVPENINLSWHAIQDFQRTVREAQDLRKVVRHAKSQKEKALALREFSDKKKEIDRYLDYGPSFERAYREFLHARREHAEFVAALSEITKLDNLLNQPSFQTIGDDAKLDRKARARLALLMEQTESSPIEDAAADERTLLAALKAVHPEGSEAFEEAKTELLGEKAPKDLRTKKDIEARIVELRRRVTALWEKGSIRRFEGERQLNLLIDAFAEGQDVLETQSVIRSLNTLHGWEQEHQRTTIGGVLVGPPGVGKTTLVRHYLEEKGRSYVYIDLSEDVTRYLLYGSKSIEFKSPAEYYKRLVFDLGDLNESEFRNFILENARTLATTLGLSDEDAAVTLLTQVEETLHTSEGQDLPPALKGKMKALQEKVRGLAERGFRKELATDFAHLVKKNGWRDGVVISALRKGESIIFDEFNKNKNWSLLYGLMTAKPGEKWYFADNTEWIQIPDDWRMYFTANIGRKHGGFQVAEALASRAGGKVMDVGYPPRKEEMHVALIALANPEGAFLRSKGDLVKLFIMVNELLPKIRETIGDKPQSIPLSFRTIRDIGEKLVLARDPKTKESVYRATRKSFDEALYEVMVASYALYEDKTIPKEIANLATSMGLLFDESVEERVVEWLGGGQEGRDEFKKRKETFAKHKDDFAQIAAKIQGIVRDVALSDVLQPRAF